VKNVNVPKEVKTYCPKCKVHQIHSVTLYKPGKRRALAHGERAHEEKKRVTVDKNMHFKENLLKQLRNKPCALSAKSAIS